MRIVARSNGTKRIGDLMSDEPATITTIMHLLHAHGACAT
jgi:hypothetical protein